MTKISIIPNVTGVGGMVTFRGRITEGLKSRGYQVAGIFHSSDNDISSVLVIGGTKAIPALRSAKKSGIRIVQRLNGMNWLHRKLNTGLKHYLRAEYGNLILRLIRSRLADHVVYQSEFANTWWEEVHGHTPVSSSVVYNAVDLNQYSPDAAGRSGRYEKPTDRFRVLMVEGSLGGGYEIGLEAGMGLAGALNEAHSHSLKLPVELMVAGMVSDDKKSQYTNPGFPQKWAGLVPADQIPILDASAHLLFSADINAACPNTVIEALACGTPVLGYDTGALGELVTAESGRVVPYGGNPWELEKPDLQALTCGAIDLFTNQEDFRIGARKQAEAKFGIDRMIDGYLEALIPN